MTELELGDGAGERGALLAAGGERQVLPADAASADGGYQLGLEAAAFAALPQPVWCIDAASRVLSVNPAFCEMAGCTQRSASGRPWTQLLLPPNGGAASSGAAAVQRLQASAAAGRPAQESLQCRSATGAPFSGQVSISPLPAVKCNGGAGPAFVCMLVGGPAPPSLSTSSGLPAATHVPAATHAAAAPLGVAPVTVPAAHAASPVAPGSPQGTTVPPQLAQLCNQALASTSESVMIMDAARPGQPICWVNKSFERLTGYSQASVVGRSHSFLAGPDSDPVVLADIDAALAEERPITAELLVYRRDGSPFWNQVSITPIRHPGNGRVANWVAVQRDISKRKAAEAAMQMREQALSNLNEGITICDPSQKDCPVVYCNDAFLRITGYSRREIIGLNCRFLQGPKTDVATVQRLATALHEGREISVELTNYRKNGEEFINLLSVTPVRDASGRLLSFIGVQSDITELVRRRQAEKELKEAKVAAEMAAEAKSMFLANMSHEIRTPLNGMIAVAQLLLASGLTPEQRELGDTILESGNTLLTILGDILDFSKIDHNSMALERAPLVLRDTVEASIEMVAADARRKGLELAYCLDDALGSGRRLLGDSVRIRQVLANLLSNAVKFTAAGEVVVDAWVEGSPEEAASQADVHAAPAEAASSGATCTSLDCPPECGDESPPPPAFPRLHLTVRDTGIGIAPSAMSHLFQCFRQGHASMTRRYGGTGLGLAISRRLAHLMDGDVWVDSQEGHGSTFHFTMALHWEGETPSPSPAATSQPDSAAAALAEPAGAPAASLPRPASTSFDSSVGVSAAEALPPGRRRSSSESAHSGPRPSFAAELGDHSAPDSVSVGSASRGAEEQRQQLQAHHEALLAKLAQSSMQRPDGSPAQASEAPLTVGLSSAHSDAPDTPSMLAPGAARAGGAMSAVSSCSRLGTLTARTGSSSALAALTSLAAATTALFSDSQRGSADAQLAAVRGSRSGDSFRSSGDTGLRPPRPPPPPTADARTSTFFTSGRPLPAVQQAVGPQVQPAPSLPPPAADYRASSFFAPSQPLPPSPLCTLRPPSDEQPAVVEEAELESDAPHAPAPLQLGMQPLSPADAAAAGGASSASPAAAAHAAPGEDAVAGRRSADSQPSIASAPDPGLQRSAGGTPTGRAAAFAKAAADGLWGSAGAAAGGPDAALLRGRSVCIDVAHGPTAVQIAQSCLLLGMRATRAPCSAMAPHAEGQEFCVTTADKALEAIRAGWRGRPLVVLGRREDLPLNLQPLATTVSKPVRHARLVAALLKAAAFSRSKQQAPLHSDPAMMTAMPDRISLNRLAVNRRISLDNSALDRRRWDAATAAAATAAAVGAVAANGGDHHEPPQGSAPANGHGASLRRSGEGQPGGVGGWAPQLPAILSDDSAGESSQRSSMEGGAGGLPTIPEQPSMPGSPFAARAQRPATPEEPAALEPAGPVGHLAALEPAAPAGHDLRILVAEDNLVNQMVIRKVLQRVVPAATVEIVGNGALALEAALARRPDLILMDIHMPEMDGIEASRRLHEALPPDEAPIVVALSADTLQMQDSKCAAAGFSAFICKPFRVEDVQRVLRLVQQ